MATNFSSFSSIDTPAQLAKKNEEVQSPLGAAMDNMTEVGFQGSMLMVLWLLNNMAEFHQDFAIDKAEGRQAVAAWAFDHGKIEAAMSILRSIDFGQNDEEETEEEAA